MVSLTSSSGWRIIRPRDTRHLALRSFATRPVLREGIAGREDECCQCARLAGRARSGSRGAGRFPRRDAACENIVSDLKTRLQRHLQVLCGDIGERHLGSPGEARAADYIAGEFAALGCPVVREEFNAPGWTYGRYGLSLTATGEAFPCFPCFYSNACEVTGKLFPFDLRDTPNLAAEAVRGRIC